MPVFTGEPDKVFVNEIIAVVTLTQVATDTTEHFLLWSEIGKTYTPSERLLHGMWLSLVRDALADGRNVRVAHPDGSALITSLTTFA